MPNGSEIKEPDIMPSAPQKPERFVPETPDKDAPEKNTPTRGVN